MTILIVLLILSVAYLAGEMLPLLMQRWRWWRLQHRLGHRGRRHGDY